MKAGERGSYSGFTKTSSVLQNLSAPTNLESVIKIQSILKLNAKKILKATNQSTFGMHLLSWHNLRFASLPPRQGTEAFLSDS